MKAIIKRNLKNYLKNPIFWIGLIVVLISMYQTLAPYLSIHYVKSDETFRKVKMASDGDVMEGCIPASGLRSGFTTQATDYYYGMVTNLSSDAFTIKSFSITF